MPVENYKHKCREQIHLLWDPSLKTPSCQWGLRGGRKWFSHLPEMKQRETAHGAWGTGGTGRNCSYPAWRRNGSEGPKSPQHPGMPSGRWSRALQGLAQQEGERWWTHVEKEKFSLDLKRRFCQWEQPGSRLICSKRQCHLCLWKLSKPKRKKPWATCYDFTASHTFSRSLDLRSPARGPFQ